MKYQIRIPSADRELVDQAAQLAEYFGESVPEAVAAVEAWVAAHGMWYLLSRNPKVYSCRDAANKRQCLGSFGISLERELKSFLGEYTDRDGSSRRVAVHCRADEELELDLVALALNASSPVVRLNASSTDESSDVYGLVNPFTLELHPGTAGTVVHVFDEALFEGDLLPPTVTTNAGERTWGIEVSLDELVAVLPPERTIRARVIVQPMEGRLWRPSIGILTGNSPESGALFWEVLNKKVRESAGELTGDVYVPRVLIRSVPAMGMTMDLHLRRAQIWDAIAPEIEGLCADLACRNEDGPNILAIACNTTPHFSPEIRKIAVRHGVRYISIAEAVEDYLQSEQIRQLVLLGIGYIHRPEFSGYASLFANPDLEIHRISERALSEIEELAFEVKEGADLNRCSQKLNTLLRRHELRHENVIIALTELSLITARAKWKVGEKVADEGGSQRMVVDALMLYADLLADLFFGKRDIETLSRVPDPKAAGPL